MVRNWRTGRSDTPRFFVDGRITTYYICSVEHCHAADGVSPAPQNAVASRLWVETDETSTNSRQAAQEVA